MTILKGSFDVYIGDKNNSTSPLEVPADGEIWVSNSNEMLGWEAKKVTNFLDSTNNLNDVENSATSRVNLGFNVGETTLITGTVDVSDINVTDNSLIIPISKTKDIVGALRVISQIPGVGFTVSSSLVTDVGNVGYLIIG